MDIELPRCAINLAGARCAPLKAEGLSASIVETLVPYLHPRETLLEIVPMEDRLVIEATLRLTDRERVYTRQTARVRVHALNIRRRPMLDGKVVAVAADALIDPKSGGSSYMAEVELDSDSKTAPYLSSLLPGMPVGIFVETGE